MNTRLLQTLRNLLRDRAILVLVADILRRSGVHSDSSGLHATADALFARAQALPLYVRDKVALTTAERLARGGRK